MKQIASRCPSGRPLPLARRTAINPRAVALPPKPKHPVRSTTALTAYALNDGELHRPIHEALVRTVYIAETLLPTRHGNFRLRGYKHSIDGGRTFVEPTAIICGEVEGKEDVTLRVHDACFTSEVLGSLKCDCAEQLQAAMEYIRDHPPGIVIYLWQEGRGIGLANKIAAYKLQEQGLDTVDANRALGLPDDLREYTSVRNILRELNVKSVKLMTNNPRKMNVLAELGVKVTDRISIQIQAGDHNKAYLEAKTKRMDHMIDKVYWTSAPPQGTVSIKHANAPLPADGAAAGGGGETP